MDSINDKLDQESLLLTKVYGDQRRYFQILMNFLSNALKFTQASGTITIKLSLLEVQSSIGGNDNDNDSSNVLKS